MGPDRHIVIYCVNLQRTELSFVTSTRDRILLKGLSRANGMNRFKAAHEIIYGYDAWTAPLAEAA